MDSNKKSKSDFRYDTGEAKVPWAAVGENLRLEDISSIIKFLIPPGEDKIAYDAQFNKLTRELEKLLLLGQYVTKLSLGNNVKDLEDAVKAVSVDDVARVTRAYVHRDNLVVIRSAPLLSYGQFYGLLLIVLLLAVFLTWRSYRRLHRSRRRSQLH